MVRSILVAMFLSFLFLGSAEAAIHLSIGNIAMAPGSAGVIDVWVSSDSPSEVLGQYGIELQIQTLVGTSQLEFVSTQSDSQLADSNYVFFGDSAVAPGPVGVVNSIFGPDDNYVGSDISLSGANYAVNPTAKLLSRLDLTTLTGNPPQAGDQFLIVVVPGVNTYFADSEFDFYDYDSTGGLVTIETQSTSIPEPLSMAVWGLFAGGVMLIRRRSSRCRLT